MIADCGEMEETLSRFLDGECGPAEAARVREHLAACAGCREALEELRTTGDVLSAGLRGHPFDERLAARISAAARRARPRARILPGPFVRRLLPVAAAAAAAVVAAGLVFRLAAPRTERHEPPPVVASLGPDAGAGARVMRPGNDGYVPAGQRFDLRQGDRLRAERGTIEVALSDGSTVVVRPDTTIELAASGVAIVDGPGDLFASVVKRRAGARPFTVEAPGGVRVEVAGTRFGVRFDGERVVTSVLEGEVRVLTARPTPEMVGPGEQLAVRLATQLCDRRAVDVRRELEWAIGRPAPQPASALAEPACPAPAPPPPPAPPRPAPAGHPAPGTGGSDLPIGAPGTDLDR